MENKEHNVLPLTIPNKTSLHAAYMPFLKGGGLFVPTQNNYAFGDEVIVITSIVYLAKKIAIPGKVVWISPQGASNSKQGVGVRFFGPTKIKIKMALESILGELGKKPALNHNY